MPAGRPPIPTTLKLLKGTLKKCRRNLKEPLFPPCENADCPFDVKKQPDAARHWNELAPTFLKFGLLTATSRTTLIHICETYADICACQAKIDREGMWVMVPVFSRRTGEVVAERERENIAVRRLIQLRYQHERLLNEFGGNPSSAAKVESQKTPAKPVLTSFAQRYLAPAKSAKVRR